MESRRVNGFFADSNFFTVAWLEFRRINGFLAESSFFAVAWLEFGSVLTLGYVDLGIVVTAVWKSDIDLGVVMSSLIWKIDVNVCT